MNTQTPDVIVVGAGAAGLSAALQLRAVGIETVVLEAAGHTGGRCVTDTATFSVPFDRGGSWLHSAPINPLARLAEERGAVLHKAPWTSARVMARGHRLSAEEVSHYGAYHKEMWAAIEAHGAETVDMPTLAALPDGPWKETAAHWVAQMTGGDADVTSVHDSYNYADAEGDWLVAGGLGGFIQELHAGVQVEVNCPVEKIDYAGTGVRVTTSRGVLEAKHLILTVSVGVLAAGNIEFTPALPAAKQDAIAALPNGLLNKVGIEFEPTWREATQGDMADYHTSDDAFCSLLFGFCGTDLAVGFVAGRFADALEREGPGAATDYVLQGLRAMYGSDALRHVRKTDETAWRSNLLTLGAYSYAKPGGAGARRVLGTPLAERVFFAGEAVMSDTYSTVHGAFLSGKQAAQQVIDTLGLAVDQADHFET